MTETPKPPDTANGTLEPPEEVISTPPVPSVPKPHERSAEVDRKIRAAVEKMFEDVRNPYEAVIVASQEARRINDCRLKARSILNQTMEHVEELVPEVPFVPRAVEDEEPEVKATNEAIEKLACGLVSYEVEGQPIEPRSYYEGEIDFPLYEEDDPSRSEESEEV